MIGSGDDDHIDLFVIEDLPEILHCFRRSARRLEALLQIGFIDVAHRSDFHTLLDEMSHVVAALRPQPISPSRILSLAPRTLRAPAIARLTPAVLTAARLHEITSIDLLAHKLFLFFANEDIVQSVAYCSRLSVAALIRAQGRVKVPEK